MITRTLLRRRWTSCALITMFIAGAAIAQPQQQQETPLVPRDVKLLPPAARAIDQEFLTDDERLDLRIFHGVWTEDDLTTPTRQAEAALQTWTFNHPSLSDSAVPVETRAEGMVLRGEPKRALDLLEGVDSVRAARLRAQALEDLGRYDEADQAVSEPVRLLLARELDDAGALTDAVRALFIRSRVRGQPARDYRTMLELLAKAREEIDRLHWPTMLAEAELLLEKDNTNEAIDALHHVIGLNPRASMAWYYLGEVALGRFDFTSARAAADALDRLNPEHPLADILLAQAALVQNDPTLALEHIETVLERWPTMRLAHAVSAAAIALTWDDEALRRALDRLDELSPGTALGYFMAGRALSFARQYEEAAVLLNEAKRRQPRWPAPQIELALLELQSGRDALALAALRDVRELDQFNKRIANSIFLLEELMMNFKQVETEHFVVRYSPAGVDQVMVDLMPGRLEKIHQTVADRFAHEPSRKTIVELMPDHQWFAVRISGMPHIHTIAACTGPVIAMEVPREGARRLHFGTYDWPRVFQHEYTHTITLSQTRNRIPHWLTEAAAVSMEFAPRDLNKVLALVQAWRTGSLFDLDEINWAFIRPKRPGDRSLAYNQGHWMVEFMNERFGESALVRLLEQYFNGAREEEAIPAALGVSRDEFFQAFRAWAADEIKAWGYAPEPSLETLMDELRERDPELQKQLAANRMAYLQALAGIIARRIGTPGARGERLTADDWPTFTKPEVEINHEQLADWLQEYPDHPDLLELAVQRGIAMVETPGFDLVPLLERYAEARPVDPSPHRTLAYIWRNSDEPLRAIPHLEELDVREQYNEVYAVELAQLYRQQGDLDKALEKIERAVNINPYSAPHRETAAAIAIENQQLTVARTHIVALTLLEPDRPQHQRRLEAIERIIRERG